MTPANQTPTDPGTPQPSPTGQATAVSKALSNPYVAYGLLALGVVLEALSNAQAISPGIQIPTQVAAWTHLIAYTLGSLGLISVGVRKLGTATMTLVMIIVVGLSSCATMTPTEQKLLDCGETALAAGAQQYLPQVGGILAGQSPNWNADLASLVTVAGPAALCALEVAISTLEQGSPLPKSDYGGAGVFAPQKVPLSVQLMRAYTFKGSQSYRVK